MDNDDLPIALRRTRRSIGATASPAPEPTQASTPRRTSKRKVRFSDPGPVSTPRTSTRASSSTGLTPMVRRANLSRSTASSTSHRRRSAPPSGSGALPSASSALPDSGEVHFLPLRHVLDGRIQRRIRRNGLSEEMNKISAEKRRAAAEAAAELERLRALVREKDAEIYELQNATIVLDTNRIWDLEREVETLREELAGRSVARGASCYEWTLAARDPFDFMETDTVEAGSVAGERMGGVGDETAFGEATVAELVCSTPSRVRSSFLTPPLTSPVAQAPMTPSSCRARTPQATHAGVQASLPDPEKEAIQEELASLRLEMSKLTSTLDSYTSLTSRLSTRLSSVNPAETSSDPLRTIEAQLTTLLQTASDRTAALLQLNNSLSALGFPGSDAGEIVSSLSSALRTARLELEYLTPGEITLPLSSRGAEVLDLLLTRLRDLARRAREDEVAVDEYHQLELSLRQQLGARVSAMDELDAELTRAKTQLQLKDDRIGELEVGVERLKGAVKGYERDVAELEGVVGRMEGENRDALATKDAQIEVGRRVLRSKEDVIAKLEGKLADATAQVRALKKRLEEAEEGRTKEVAALTRRSGQALALRDARVAELRGEVERLGESLRAAHEGVKDLRVEKGGLEGRLVEEKEGAKRAIDRMKAELERVVSMSREFLEKPAESTSASDAPKRRSGETKAKGKEAEVAAEETSKGLFSGDLARRSSGKKRRKYDSGLGFFDEDEVDA
ncbi:hypothetical protein CSOJ01_06275 [Colletotrichum sojae]|uniref:Glycolipid 2-alpha-mannosyltransferase n=1 Tax=Colletotrichum sojae TaxID=2175907 RepID=A0A8H6JCN1_9PEZI|nr:hypothetical protein CSOJ01_06275 [Colletotrichum sojae]